MTTPDPKWETVFASVQSRGNRVFFHVEVRLKNGLLVSQNSYLEASELDVDQFGLYKWMLDGLVKKLDEMVQARP